MYYGCILITIGSGINRKQFKYFIQIILQSRINNSFWSCLFLFLSLLAYLSPLVSGFQTNM